MVPPRIRTAFVLTLLVSLAIFVVVRSWRLRRPADDPQHPSLAGMCDFRDVIYYPTRAALAGVNPYDARPPAAGGEYLARYPAGNEFSPYAPLLFALSAPLAALPLTAAEIAFCALNLGLLASYGYWLLRFGGNSATFTGGVALAGFLLVSRPGQSNYYYGQATLVFVLATIGAWWLVPKRPVLSAVCLALALIKPTFGGPLVVLMLLCGWWRVAGLGLAIAIVANGVVFGTLLPEHFASGQAIARLTENQAATDEDPAVDPLQSASRIDLPFVAERLSGRVWPAWARYSLTLLLLAIAGAALSKFSNRDPVLTLGFVVLTITICIYHNIYDALLVAVAGVAAWRAAVSRSLTLDRGLAVALLLLVLVPALHYSSSKQFLAVVAGVSPAVEELTQLQSLWTLLCIANGVSLTVAWCLILALLRRSHSICGERAPCRRRRF